MKQPRMQKCIPSPNKILAKPPGDYQYNDQQNVRYIS